MAEQRSSLRFERNAAEGLVGKVEGSAFDANGLERRERRFVLIFLACVCVALAHFVAVGWMSYSASPGPVDHTHDLFAGTDYAPNQYRLAMAYLTRFLVQSLHLSKGYLLAGALDGAAAYVALWFLYLRLARSRWMAQRVGPSRTVVIALFLAAAQLPMAWVVPWQRPETLPCAAYLAVSLYLLPKLSARPALGAVLFLGTVWQAFVRSDVPLVFGIAMVLLGLLGRSQEIVSSRRLLVGWGVVVAGVAGGIQAWMKYILFPNAVYPPDTPALQIWSNLHVHFLSIFLVALLPWIALVWLARRTNARLDAMDQLTVVASVLYLPLWMTVAVIGEVRVYVPFLLVLCPVAAKIVSVFLAKEPAGDEPVSA